MKVQSVFFFSLAAIAAAFEAGITDADSMPVPTAKYHLEDDVELPLVTGEVVFNDATNEYEYSEGDFEGNSDQELADYLTRGYEGDAHSENPEDIHKLIEHIKEKKCPKKKCLNKIVKTKTCYVTLYELHTKTVKKQCAAPTKKPVKKQPVKKQPVKKRPSKKERCPDCGSNDCDGGNQCPNKGNKGNKKQQSKKERCPDCGSTDCGGGNQCPNKGNKGNKGNKKQQSKKERCPNCGGSDCGGCSGNNHSKCPNCGSRNCGGDC
ncbi:hypothetical protein CJU89_2194 [Yarrowia sp. B02]|nr:hypothetical protein CJU89_2194 [Yarrowia sp. B02]